MVNLRSAWAIQKEPISKTSKTKDLTICLAWSGAIPPTEERKQLLGLFFQSYHLPRESHLNNGLGGLLEESGWAWKEAFLGFQVFSVKERKRKERGEEEEGQGAKL